MSESSVQSKLARTARLFALATLVAGGVSGCWWDESGSSSALGGGGTPPPPPPPPAGASIAGSVVGNFVNGSAVTAYTLNADGTLGASLGSATSAADGSYTITLSSTPSGAVEVVAAGGTYTSESDATTVTLGTLRALVPTVGSSGVTGIVVSPLSDMALERAVALIKGGASVADALAAALALVETNYGFTSTLAGMLPDFAKTAIGTDPYLFGLVLGSLETCAARTTGVARGDLFSALSLDFSDGLFDGRKDGAPVTLGAGSLSSTAGTSDFLSCVSGYASSGASVLAAGVTPTDLVASVATIRGAVSSSPATPKSVGLSAGSSGAISTLAFGGRQWVFFAARSNGVVAVDVTDPDAASPTTKVFSSLVGNFGGAQIGGVVPLVGADHPQLLVFAYGSKHIALVDADTGAVDYEADLPLAAVSPVYFSGGSAYIAGAIPDTALDGVWLATADGYVFFDRASQSLSTMFSIDPSNSLAENMGGDVSHGLLFAPNYAPGVQLVDLVSATSYYFDGSAFDTAFSGRLYEPDGGAVDSGYQVGIITNEDTDDIGFINLATVVKTTVPGGKSTFLPAASGGQAYVNLDGPVISGSAVDSDTHLVLFMAGYSSDVAVGQLEDPAVGASWKGLTDWRFYRNLPGYSIARDPHAVAVVKNLSNGKAYGYLLDGTARKGFQIDMSAFLAGAAAGTTGSDAHRLASDPVADGIVRALSW